MDSFCSLFDPSDGQSKKKTWPDQDNVKKKLDTPKSRRRGRKAQGKNETLPEESSFLCEPALSSELLVKDGSYLDSYVEIKNDPKADDKKPKRRNSGRKNRRRKKVSPAKDEEDDTTAWNNQTAAASAGGGAVAAVGRRVNDLGDYRRRGKEMHNVIDKLEQVTLKDDTYLSGEFGADELRDEAWCSSDREESQDDSASSGSDSGTEAHGSLPPEPRFGNVEYKLQLVAPCERRFQHLVTQLKWRLRSGGGAAVYLLGVRDCGALRGLRARALRASLHTLRRMAGALRADLAHVSARRVAPHRAVAEVYIRKLADTQQSELRVAVMGANEAGKSTLIGVLTQGELDNGRGSARLNMFRHLHEVKSGRTSSLSHEILGFDAQGNVVNYGCSELMTAERIGERSAKLVSFLDLAGHSKYQRTTLHGLTGYCPHYAMLVISATAGITRITEEHIGLLLALALPFFCVVSKCELAAAPPLLARLADILAPHNKKPLLITDENSARHCVRPQRLLLDTIDGVDDVDADDDQTEVEQIPVFPVSCVRGLGLSALHAYLLALEPPQEPHAQPDTNDNFPVSCVRGLGLSALHAYLLALEPPPEPHAQPDTNDNDTVEFQIDEIFHVGDSAGPVVGGLLARGQLAEGDSLIIGPLDTGEFVDVTVRSIYRNRVPCGGVRAGQSASLGLSRGIQPRPGMVLLCPPEARQDYKNGNIYRDIATAESSLAKQTYSRDNLYVSDADGDRAWSAGGEVLLEDPNDPRGCMYFQATVHVLRHSTAIARGFQCTAHVGNVRQTAIIEGIMSHDGALRCGQTAPALFRFLRQPEFLVRGRRLLLAAGQGTRAIGRVTQIFPYVP